jgi:WD40 repeat protein
MATSGSQVKGSEKEKLSGSTVMWDATSGKQLFSVIGIFPSFTPDGKRIIVDDGGNARVYDGTSGRQLPGIPGVEKFDDKLCFSPDGRRLVTKKWNVVEVRDAESGLVLLTFRGHKDEVMDAHFSVDGRQLFSVDNSQMNIIWDAAPISTSFSKSNTSGKTGGLLM